MKLGLTTFLILLLLSSQTYAFNHEINIKCTETQKKIYDKNRKNVSNNQLHDPYIYTFDTRKKKLIKHDLNKKANWAALINKDRIYWHMWKENQNVDFIKSHYGMQTPGVVVSELDINRFTGAFSYKMYVMDAIWSLKYLGSTLNSDGKWEDAKYPLGSQRELQNFMKVLDTGVKMTRNNNPQKDIIFMAHMTGECKKIDPTQKF